MGLAKIIQNRILLFTISAFTLVFLFTYNHYSSEVQLLTGKNVRLLRLLSNSKHNSPFDNNENSQMSGETNGYEQQPLMANSGQATNEDDQVVIYNRVPKTASTSFMGIAYDLCKPNRYHVLHLNTSKNAHVMSIQDQQLFVENVTSWTAMKPALYHGHVAWINFANFGQRKPIYVNLIREPLERLVSYYYFLRYGDDFRPHVVRKRKGNKMTFDECVHVKGHDCDPNNMWLQIPFFCGHTDECWRPGSKAALSQAKANLINEYLLVGVTERLEDFVNVLEATLPRFFKGALNLYTNGTKGHLRRTYNKLEPADETIDIIKESPVYKLEREFYEFALQQFEFVLKNSFEQSKPDGKLIRKPTSFFFEKIRPR